MFAKIEEFLYDMQRARTVALMAYDIYLVKRERAMDAGTYKFPGLFGDDGLVDESWREAVEQYRRACGTGN